MPIEVLEAVLTTAAIEVAVMPREGVADGFSAVELSAAAASSAPPLTWIGLHFSYISHWSDNTTF